MATTTSENNTEETESRYRAPALEKGLDVLELLAREGDVLTTSQIANKLGRSVSELFRMVLTLEGRGYIAQVDGRDGYGLTNKLFSLGIAQTPTRNLIELALPKMKILAEEIGQSCHLTVASNDQIVVVARIESPRDLGFSVRVGYRRPIVESTSGILLCALLTDSEREGVLNKLQGLSNNKTMDSFRDKIDTASQDGFIMCPSDFVDGVVDLSSPIFARKGVIAALTVPYVKCHPENSSPEVTLEKLRESTAQISELMQDEAR